jgi:predicted RNase H-like HicB family nuclease
MSRLFHPTRHPVVSNEVVWALLLRLDARERDEEVATMAHREFYVVIEKDEDGFFVGEVPGLSGCYSQGRTVDELLENIREVIALCLEENPDQEQPEFVGLQKVALT